ncbi:Nucleolar protein 56 [Tieghemiomyces parasiticus]|uniref:Nucleolar protein 56 n=1 Tax=Tieghemiomyces parasiticus TaxID=78921 RepID=A0A9W8AI38_9FUNG|nr:Nucleolar protein 56 [Tieghemiomyces parasiticus]KAJ1930030.1 Nucleolar protein 56 [Tieghemiomyces parasiticus]
MSMYVLFETSSGYSLFERTGMEEIGAKLSQVQEAAGKAAMFSKVVRLVSFVPFKSAADALENANDVSEGVVNETLSGFLEMNLGKFKAANFELGVGERNLAGAIKQQLGYNCVSDEIVLELIRGIRAHADVLLKQMKESELYQAQLGLGHSYSRAKVKFNVNRSDNMIIQAIGLLDQLDKDVNTFAMRAREWYSWHFPELGKIVSDHGQFARLVKIIRNKSTLTEDQLPAIEEVVQDEARARQILDASRTSMGTDISEVDLINIENFATRVVSITDYRKSLHEYLLSKMGHVAPNLGALIGEMVGARLIAHAGSLTNLSKFPASTVQILGAEKALFRALKTRGKTPKYGLIYHSSFIGRAGVKNKGRISRFLANKCTIASRIDCYTETPTTKFGEALRKQVEGRLAFYEQGAAPQKNIDVMTSVVNELKAEESSAAADPASDELVLEEKVEKKIKKKQLEADMAVDEETVATPKKEKKKSKKNKKESGDGMDVDTPVSSKKKKSKK